MHSRRTRIWISAAVFFAAFVAGALVARPLAPERLHADIEARLAQMLGGPARVGTLRVAWGWGLVLEGSDVEVWPRSDGPSLRIDRVIAHIRPFAHLTGSRHLRSLRLERPVLRLTRDAEGAWSPARIATLLARRPGTPAPSEQRELLQPLLALEGAIRSVLRGAMLADGFEVTDGRIEVAVDEGGEQPTLLGVEGVQLRLARRFLLGDTRLALRARLFDRSGERGTFEGDGRWVEGDELRVALATTDLELPALLPALRRVRPDADLDGRLSGMIAFESREPGHGRIETDLVGHDVHSATPVSESWQAGTLEAGRIELGGALAVSPDSLRAEGLRLRTDGLELELDGTLGRPLAQDSSAELAIAARGVTVAEVRHWIGWLPEVRREDAEAVLASLEAGRLALRTAGTASLSAWQAFLAGRSQALPHGFVVDAHLEDTSIRVGESDRIEKLQGRLWWTGDRVEVRGATAQLNGSPLPELDLSFDGAGHLFASDPESRRLGSGARPLLGLRPLWQTLSNLPRKRGESGLTSVRVEFERLEHPMFFWPIDGAVATIEPIDGGVRVSTEGGTLAGVPVEGEGEWLFEPKERVRAHFTAGAPQRRERPDGAGPIWARGHFELGAMRQGRWRHEGARGRFEATGGELRFEETSFALAPQGELRAQGKLTLSRPDAVPFSSSFSLKNGDVRSLSPQLGLPTELATGRVDLTGELAGRFDPATPLVSTLSGTLDMELRDGNISQAVPAVVAIALASEAVNPFARREQIRYEHISTRIELQAGTLASDALALDGPDVRAFASGSIGVADPKHPVDLEVVLFLFRPVDNVLEKIPLVNLLLLGRDNNLVAATIALDGSWDAPRAHLLPHRSLASGPGHLVFEELPDLVRRGLEALNSVLPGRVADGEKRPRPLPAAPPADS